MTARLPSAILLYLLATLLFSLLSACVRLLSRDVPVGEIVFFRSTLALLPLTLYLAAKGQFPSGIVTRHPRSHLLRGVFSVGSMYLSFLTLSLLPQANATALSFVAPLLVMGLAPLILRERPHTMVFVGAVLGFAGILVMVLPALQGSADTTVIYGTLSGLGCAACTAAAMTQIKRLTATENPGAIVLYFCLSCGTAGLLSSLFTPWVMPGLATVGLLFAAGLAGGLAHIAMTESLARAPATVVAPLEYTSMLWAVGFDLVLFDLFPGPMTLLGSGVIIASAVLVTVYSRRPRTA
ncbi:DMT family transporter [Novispirillum itersonii]|uniref:DMT family transporter n=1 Tax=Novispirillum itersonii TaxID=189 RepID=UPI00037E820D|nr:DMT family transporter [Novispirillum itersonii]